MIAEDFEYAGEYLSDWGFMICSIENMNNVKKNLPSLAFNNVSLMNGRLFELTTSNYEDRMEITFQICKSIDICKTFNAITVSEQRELARWLNRSTFHKFKLLQPDWADIYSEGSFNITNIEFGGEVYFLELTFISNRPLALHEPVTYKFQTTVSDNQYVFFDKSDEVGYIYPNLKIICLKSGDLKIHNSIEDRTTIVKNCSINEIIDFSKELLLSSSIASHKIQNDFNYIFMRIANKYGNRKNILTFSMPVKIELTYSPYVKVVM